MTAETQQQLLLFTNNAQTIKSEFPWQNTQTKRLAALLYALENQPVDCEAIRQCHAMMKQNTGVFSTFRGNMALCVAALLSLSPDPRKTFSETLKVYDLLKSVRFRASDYLAVAAYEIAAQAAPADYLHVVTRTRAFYDGMKTRHFFCTGQDDYVFAAMLGLSDLDVATGTERIERLHSRLKGEFWDKNSVQALAQVLVLGGSDGDVAGRVLALRDALRAQKIKLDKSYTLPSLGVLILLPAETDAIVRDTGEAQAFLREQKGFGPLSVATQELLLFATAVVAGEYARNIKEGVLTATLSTSITNIIIAQQAAMIAIMSSSATAAAHS